MYNISALQRRPERANLTWGLGSSYAYHVPKAGKQQTVNYVSCIQTNNKMGYVPTDMTDRVSRIYDYYLLMKQDYEEQLNEYCESVAMRGGYSPLTHLNFTHDEINNKKQFARRLGREILIRLANCIKEAEQEFKNLADSLETVYLLISYIVAVRIPSQQSLERSPAQRLVRWLSTFWISRPLDERANIDEHIELLEAFQLAQFDEVLKKIDQLLENRSQSHDFQNKLIRTRELIISKVRFFGNGENTLLNSQSYRAYLQDFVAQAKSVLQELFPYQDAQDPCYVILSILSGNLETIRRLAGNKWKVYVLMYMAYYDPMMEFSQLPKVLEQYLTKINFSSKESLFAIRLFQPDMHAVLQSLLPVVPPTVICTVGFLCHDLALTKVLFEVQLFGMPLKKYLLEQMLEWTIEAKWQAARPYLRQYSHYMQVRQGEQFLSEIMSRKFEVRKIESKDDLQMFLKVCGQYREMQIPCQAFVRSTLIRQVKSECFEHILDVLDIYRRQSGQAEPLKYLFKMCVDMTNDGQFDYSSLVRAVSKRGPFETAKVSKIFKTFILMDRVRSLTEGSKEAFESLLATKNASMMPDEVVSLLTLLKAHYGVENLEGLQIQTQTFLKKVLLDGNPNDKHIMQLMESTRANYF